MIFIARAFPYWITVVGVLGVMAVIFFTNHGGAFGRPHWPARFPHRPRPRHSDRWALLRRASRPGRPLLKVTTSQRRARMLIAAGARRAERRAEL